VKLNEEEKLDETIAESFPASDPPANTPETGVHLEELDSAHAAEIDVHDRPDANRFEAVVNGQVAFLEYERRGNEIVFLHTEVPEPLRGHGVASQLAKAAIASARARNLKMVVRCPFVRAYLKKHPDA
jgi:uncharacterized protein